MINPEDRAKAADRCLDFILADEDSVASYAWLASHLGPNVTTDDVKKLKEMMKTRVRVRFPDYLLRYDNVLRCWRLVKILDATMTKTHVAYTKSATGLLRLVAEVDKLDGLSDAQRLLAQMAAQGVENYTAIIGMMENQ